MALTLTQQVETNIPIEVAGIVPDRLAGKSLSEIENQPILFGNRERKLADHFKVSGSLDDGIIRFEGHLTHVHWIGARQRSGRIEVTSSTGNNLGSQLFGGLIQVTGNVADNAGAEMSGGEIHISGDAGENLGGRYPGSKLGMNRGSIFLEGSTGKGAGQGMRRGNLIIGHDADELCGWNMLAGTICIRGTAGRHIGAGMKRGTIIAGHCKLSSILPTFYPGDRLSPPIMSIFARWLATKRQKVEFMEQPLNSYSGDHLQGGRGELFVNHLTRD